jgi:hypothetical protein
MMDDDFKTGEGASTSASSDPASERVAFCQDCGKPLTRETVRPVGSGVFCEPCLERRLGMGAPLGGVQGATGWGQVPPPAAGAATVSGAVPPPPKIPTLGADEPKPALAALLGIIPGVGAMYNGQFAKGVAHLVIFAVLVWMSNNIHGIFGMFVAGWVFYQSFEAYHTAKARRDGLPLPDPFGLNDIGDRINLGVARTPAGTAAVPPAGPSVPPAAAPGAGTTGGWTTASGATGPTASAGTYAQAPVAGYAAPPVQAQPSVASSWLGYVPPQSYAGNYGAGGAAPYTQPASGPAAPYVGASAYPTTPPVYQDAFSPANVPAVDPMMSAQGHMPSGAFWLIGLGVIVLLFNIIPGWHMSAGWMSAVLLAGFAVFSLLRRISLWGARWPGGMAEVPAGVWVHAARVPAILLTVAVLLALQAADWLTFGQTWPILLVVIGVFLLAERVMPAGAGFGSAPFDPRQPVAAWPGTGASTAGSGVAAAAAVDSTKTPGGNAGAGNGGH